MRQTGGGNDNENKGRRSEPIFELPDPPVKDEFGGPFGPPRDDIRRSDSRYHTDEIIEPEWYNWEKSADKIRKQNNGRCEVCGAKAQNKKATGEKRDCYSAFIETADFSESNHAYVCEDCIQRPDWREIARNRREVDRGVLERMKNSASNFFFSPHGRLPLFARRLLPLLLVIIPAVVLIGIPGVEVAALIGAILTSVVLGVHTLDWSRRDPIGWIIRWENPNRKLLLYEPTLAVLTYVILETDVLPITEAVATNNLLVLALDIAWITIAILILKDVYTGIKIDAIAAEGLPIGTKTFWQTGIRGSIPLAVGSLVVGFPLGLTQAQEEAAIVLSTLIPVGFISAYLCLRIIHSERFQRYALSIAEKFGRIKSSLPLC